eukprot:INCI3238.1.p1 GENE.INCI3238.1~~INCI3238.1.p1  ORF type:complete len:222 (+),score=34.52 INCI3238.1:258-923(+)
MSLSDDRPGDAIANGSDKQSRTVGSGSRTGAQGKHELNDGDAEEEKAVQRSRNNMSYFCKNFALYAFLGVDLFLNAICDHVFYDVNSNVNNRRLSACQIIIQVLIFFSLLLLMFDTFPYEVGLIGILTKSNFVFRLLLVVAPLYLVVSIIAVGYRVYYLWDDVVSLIDLWLAPEFSFLSGFQKILAVFYYAVVSRAATVLGYPRYYNSKYWASNYSRILEK